MIRVEVNPGMLRWAYQRAGLDRNRIARKIPQLAGWESGKTRPTLKQIERFSKLTHAPVGYLFLDRPPTEELPIPDFRTAGNVHVGHASPNLLDTIYICQQRQEWYHNYARSNGEEALAFVGAANSNSNVEITASSIRQMLKFDLDERAAIPTWTEALRRFIQQADTTGILVMCSSVVLNNNSRHLDPEEFRGFAMSDDLAPLIFINGADTKAAQMFTLAHEIAHVWRGQSAISDSEASLTPDHEVELWCNRVAAELLVPLSVLKREFRPHVNVEEEASRLARRFKVSSLVALRRVFDMNGLTREEFWKAYRAEEERLRALPRRSGGDFYLTQAARVSKRFAHALVVSTLEGQTLHRDAFHMLGFTRLQTFLELGRSLKII